MNRRQVLLATCGIAIYAATSSGSEFAGNERLPSSRPKADAERADTIRAMAPPKRPRPLIAVLADNRGTETTDFVVPWGILKRAGRADVFAVAITPGPIRLMPSLRVHPELTIAQFDEEFPLGADYVIVPAFHDPKSSAPIEWIQKQGRGGATIIGVCAGALPIAYAGLLEGKRATTHWFDIGRLQRISPNVTVVEDRRYVADRGIVTSTGVSASLPLSLTLVEAIAGEGVSNDLAAAIGVATYDSAHDSARYRLNAAALFRAAANGLNIMGHERLGLPVEAGVDEITLALTADAWSRTYRSTCYTVAACEEIETLGGLRIIRDFDDVSAEDIHLLPPLTGRAGTSLDHALRAIEARYGRSTAAFVALQLEYPWPVNL